jgi:metallo-beta-lactamase family protein
MKIFFHGACQEVTGSCCLVEVGQTKFLVDCGMFQGSKFAEEHNLNPFPFDPKTINFVLLTHAHMDHCGRLPKLYKEGFRGQIYCTAPTADFTKIMLVDSARVIFEEALAENRLPLYLLEDANAVGAHFFKLPYRQERQITSEIRINLRDAGHILGSTIFEVWVKEGRQEKKIVFSGDLGNPPQPLVEDTEFISGADYLVVESLYGGIIHEPAELRLQMLRQAITESVGRGGVLMIPAFALERTQEILYELNYLVENKKVPPVPIFVDSPLAIQATDVYKKYVEMYDKESRNLIEAGDDLFNFPGLTYTYSKEESKKINNTPSPKVILAGSGMCTGGRMVYHLKFNLSNPLNHLLIIGYQAAGSLGRHLLEGAREVEAAGERVKVKAKVSAIGAYSAHADQPKILHWVKMMAKPRPQKVFVVHGEEKQSLMVADGLKQKLSLEAVMPKMGEKFDI